ELDLLLRFADFGKVFEVNRIVGNENLRMLPLWDKTNQRFRVKNQSIADSVKIVKEHVANPIVRIIQVARLRPQHNRDSRQLEPVNQGPENTVLHVQKQNHDVGLQPQNLRAVLQKAEGALDELEPALVLILLL